MKATSKIEKRGRPTTDPKPHTILIRMGDDDIRHLKAVAKARKADKSATIRALIAEAYAAL